jgi:DNA-binding cell septation regulator SpoVG
MSDTVVIEEFRERRANTLRGFLTVRLPSGLVLHDVTLHQGEDGCWVGMPSKPMLDADGNVVRDARGKVRYVNLITTFRWSDMACVWVGRRHGSRAHKAGFVTGIYRVTKGELDEPSDHQKDWADDGCRASGAPSGPGWQINEPSGPCALQARQAG